MALDPDTLDQLAEESTIDLTTVGRRSGEPARVEIWWFRVEGRFIITGTPGPRDWMANVLADSRIVIHAGGRDLPATAVPITDEGFRRRVFTSDDISWYRTQSQLERLVAEAPMIEIRFDQSVEESPRSEG